MAWNEVWVIHEVKIGGVKWACSSITTNYLSSSDFLRCSQELLSSIFSLSSLPDFHSLIANFPRDLLHSLLYINMSKRVYLSENFFAAQLINSTTWQFRESLCEKRQNSWCDPELVATRVDVSVVSATVFSGRLIHLSALLRCTEELKGGGRGETSATNQPPPSCGNLRVTSSRDCYVSRP